MKIEQVIHHDLAYVIQKGMAESGLYQGMNFTPNAITLSLPGNAWLVISVYDKKLKYQLQFLGPEGDR